MGRNNKKASKPSANARARNFHRVQDRRDAAQQPAFVIQDKRQLEEPAGSAGHARTDPVTPVTAPVSGPSTPPRSYAKESTEDSTTLPAQGTTVVQVPAYAGITPRQPVTTATQDATTTGPVTSPVKPVAIASQDATIGPVKPAGSLATGAWQAATLPLKAAAFAAKLALNATVNFLPAATTAKQVLFADPRAAGQQDSLQHGSQQPGSPQQDSQQPGSLPTHATGLRVIRILIGGVVKVFDLLMVPYTFYLAWRDMRTEPHTDSEELAAGDSAASDASTDASMASPKETPAASAHAAETNKEASLALTKTSAEAPATENALETTSGATLSASEDALPVADGSGAPLEGTPLGSGDTTATEQSNR